MRLLNCFIVIIYSLLFSTSLVAQVQDRAQLEKDYFALRAELDEKLKDKEKQLLSVTEEEKENYSRFLQQPETGLVRIFSRNENQV